MATTRQDVIVPKATWTNLYSSSGITVGTQVEIYNKSTSFCKIATSLAAPTTVDGFHLTAFPEENPLEIAPGEAGLWAYAPNGPIKILVQEKSLEKNSNGALWTTQVHPKGMDFYTAVGLGLVPGCRRVTALGNNPDIDLATLPEDIWSGGGVYPWLTASTSLEIVSTNVNDSSTGTGARTVLIQGLDINYIEVSQTVTLNGTTPVAIPTQLFRINSALIMSAGSGKVNAGDINIRDVGGGTIRAIIPLGYGTTRQSVYTVPAGHTLSIHSQFFNNIRSGGTVRDTTIANFIQSPNGFYRLPLELDVDGNPYRHDATPGVILPEKTDYAHRVTFVSAANDTNVTTAILGILISNTTLGLV